MLLRLSVVLLLLPFRSYLQGQVCCKEPEADSKVILRHVVFAQPMELPVADQHRLVMTLRKVNLRLSRGESPNDLASVFDEYVRQAYQNRGYFLAEPRCDALPIADNWSNSRGNLLVDLFVNVKEGTQYRVQGILWRGQTIFSEEELTHAFPIVPGSLFDRSKITGGLDAVRNLYRARGYINFTLVPITKIDEVDRTIQLDIEVDEGKAYHWGGLHVDGMSDSDNRVLLNAWERLRGQPFTGRTTELAKFFDKYFRSIGHRHNLADYVKTYINESKGTVDVQLKLRSDPSLVRDFTKTRFSPKKKPR